ncbi:DUF3298 and DUF4163 domain-containing protein [Tepidibacter aestuarii]|uniref:DUF3298 and DUF4163 domain-containing protein n=1 Tax=Tepidibacter aestuarii TaxID=2925782 RepID=UPI0020BDD829|nr:DUF3298 and DUF4163 domain-containing protein [Tepidibacter aestuarii]CAH2213458.1 conserved protein of unknown function [Tepidibacter aestuarii]
MNYIQNFVQIIPKKLVKPGYKVVIEYPLVIGMTNQSVQKKINDSILFLVNKLYIDQVNQLVFIQGYPQIPKIEVTGWFEIKTNERGILSLSIGNYTIAYPSAHGFTIIKSLTFDIQTGKIYQLYDLFKPESNYMEILSNIISNQIKDRDIHLINKFKGIKTSNQDYYIADKALVIYFQLYELTAYVYGFPYFPISVYEIQDIIQEDSPLYKMLS